MVPERNKIRKTAHNHSPFLVEQNQTRILEGIRFQKSNFGIF
jgi:hypothetical protein